MTDAVSSTEVSTETTTVANVQEKKHGDFTTWIKEYLEANKANPAACQPKEVIAAIKAATGYEVKAAQVSIIRGQMNMAATRGPRTASGGKRDDLESMLTIIDFMDENGGREPALKMIRDVNALLDNVGGKASFDATLEHVEKLQSRLSPKIAATVVPEVVEAQPEVVSAPVEEPTAEVKPTKTPRKGGKKSSDEPAREAA